MLSKSKNTLAGSLCKGRAKETCLRKSRKSRSKAKPSRKRGGDPSRVYLVDQLDKDFTLAERYRKPVLKYYGENHSTSLQRLPNQGPELHAKLGIYSSTELCQVAEPDFGRAFNKASRIFGLISKEKHFSYALMCVTVCGMNAGDFRNLMRIRDLWIRGCRTAYKRNIINFSFSLPRFARERLARRLLERRVEVMT